MFSKCSHDKYHVPELEQDEFVQYESYHVPTAPFVERAGEDGDAGMRYAAVRRASTGAIAPTPLMYAAFQNSYGTIALAFRKPALLATLA